jgi:hypothetical protein
MTPEKALLAQAEFDEALNLLEIQNLKKFDPFDKVHLSSKGIDNSILTSFRTLTKKNNTISDTFKIIHQQFQPYKQGNNTYANRKDVPLSSKFAEETPIDMSEIVDQGMRPGKIQQFKPS